MFTLHQCATRTVTAVCFALVSIWPVGVAAQTARIQLVPLPSKTLTDQQVLSGRAQAAPAVVLAAELRLPAPTGGKLPAIVMLHGSGGISGNVDEWAQKFVAMGIATLVVDSFSGRGIASTVADQDQLGRLSAVVDAYRALEFLARHPAIDPQRVAIMGFSRGAQAAVYSSMQRLYRLHEPVNDLRFAVHIGMYTPCGTTYLGDYDVINRPIRLFHGGADDYVPGAPCKAYAVRLQQQGRDVAYTEYAGAHHVFDWPLLQSPMRLANAQVTANCVLSESSEHSLIDAVNDQPFLASKASCATRGATVAYDAMAHRESLKAVQGLLEQTLLNKK